MKRAIRHIKWVPVEHEQPQSVARYLRCRLVLPRFFAEVIVVVQ